MDEGNEKTYKVLGQKLDERKTPYLKLRPGKYNSSEMDANL